MPRKVRELRAEVAHAGFKRQPGKGSHTKWKHPRVPGTLVISGGDGDDAKPYQEHEVKDWLNRARAAQKGSQP